MFLIFDEVKKMSEGYKVVHREKSNWFFIRLDKGKAAYLKYTRLEKTLSVDHTHTPEEYRGKGLAKRLMLAVINYAKRNNLKIIPNCSYAQYFFEKNPEFRDLMLKK